MTRFMLDTNTVSHLIRAHGEVVRRVTAAPVTALCISVVTEAELHFGLAKRPEAKRLHLAVHELLKRVDVLPWGGSIAPHYGALRADLEQRGKMLAPLDLMIAAHAHCLDMVLITNDGAFAHVDGLALEDWTREP